MDTYILVLGAELCPTCPVAKRWCEVLASVIGVGFRYLDVEKDEYAKKLYEEALSHGYEGVPQIYFVCKGEPYFIINGLPENFEKLVEIFAKMLRHYGIDVQRCRQQ